MTIEDELIAAGERLARWLAGRKLKIVFAESCTAGLIAATLSRTPSISAWLCGSAVVYQVETKARWLDISETLLDHPVSAEVATAMARQVLLRTPHADLAASVTGHLGPDAPPDQDGLIYAAVAVRATDAERPTLVVRGHRLSEARRVERQQEAARFVLDLVQSAT